MQEYRIRSILLSHVEHTKKKNINWSSKNKVINNYYLLSLKFIAFTTFFSHEKFFFEFDRDKEISRTEYDEHLFRNALKYDQSKINVLEPECLHPFVEHYG